MGYWNRTGQYQAEADVLSELIPDEGNCETLKGEIWRAATKIYHDYFNNGFGNKWKSPAEFLLDNIQLPTRVENVLLDHANGNTGNSFEYEMDSMIDTVILRLRDMEDIPNKVDMWDYRSPVSRNFEPNFWDYEDEDEDDYY